MPMIAAGALGSSKDVPGPDCNGTGDCPICSCPDFIVALSVIYYVNQTEVLSPHSSENLCV